MKRLFALLMCIMLVICASCGKKDDGVNNQTEIVEENNIKQITEDIDKKIEQDPASIEKSDIDAAKENADKIEQDLKNQAGKVAQEDVEQYQNRQAAVAILKQGLEALEKAQAEGDEAAIESAKMQIKMAQSLWDFKQEE